MKAEIKPWDEYGAKGSRTSRSVWSAWSLLRLAGAFPIHCISLQPESGSKLRALQALARGSIAVAANGAKRLECVRLAGAFPIRCIFVATRKREQAPRTPNAGANSCALATNGAKHLECVRLAGAFPIHCISLQPESGSKLRALQTLARCSVAPLRFSCLWAEIYHAPFLKTLTTL